MKFVHVGLQGDTPDPTPPPSNPAPFTVVPAPAPTPEPPAPSPVAPTPETVPVDRPVVSRSQTHLIAPPDAWGWEQLRDYVCSSIQDRFGPFPRNPVKERSIFSSFSKRWGDDALIIAKRAVEVHGCVWANAPISVNRFTKGSDQFFAAKILAEIKSAA